MIDFIALVMIVVAFGVQLFWSNTIASLMFVTAFSALLINDSIHHHFIAMVFDIIVLLMWAPLIWKNIREYRRRRELKHSARHITSE